MKISTRMTVGFAVVVGMIIPSALFSLRTYRRIHQEFEVLKEDILPGAVLMMEMETITTETHRHLMEYLMHEATEAQEEEEARSGLKQLRSIALEHLEHETHIGKQEKDKAVQLVAKVARFTSAGLKLIDMKKRGTSFSEIAEKEEQILHPADEALIGQLMAHKAVRIAEIAHGQQAVHNAHVAGVAIVTAAGICAALAATAAALITTRSVTKPIRSLQEGTRRIAAGDLNYRIGMERKDELGDLGRDFDRMAENLSKTLTSKKTLDQANDQLVREVINRKHAEEALAASNRDLTLMTKRLEQVNRELTDFVYVASHDLREPLRKIASFGTLLKESLEGKLEKDDCENLAYMIDGAERMTQMIEGLLAYSRLNASDNPLETVDLNYAVEQLERLELAAMLEETGGTIELPQPLPKVKGDPAQLRQLLQNLIANGIKYRRDAVAPRIVLGFRYLDDETVRIEVRDNGIGISEKHREDIFKMFRRLHSRRKYQGTGIGLAICKKIVDRHSGQIGMESKPGEGSTFWFTLRAIERASARSEPLAVS